MKMRNLPQTRIVNAQQATATLSFAEMTALDCLFRESISPEQTVNEQHRLLQLAADYAAIASFVGPTWQASSPGSRVDAMQFLARIALEEARISAADEQ